MVRVCVQSATRRSQKFALTRTGILYTSWCVSARVFVSVCVCCVSACRRVGVAGRRVVCGVCMSLCVVGGRRERGWKAWGRVVVVGGLWSVVCGLWSVVPSVPLVSLCFVHRVDGF